MWGTDTLMWPNSLTDRADILNIIERYFGPHIPKNNFWKIYSVFFNIDIFRKLVEHNVACAYDRIASCATHFTSPIHYTLWTVDSSLSVRIDSPMRTRKTKHISLDINYRRLRKRATDTHTNRHTDTHADTSATVAAAAAEPCRQCCASPSLRCCAKPMLCYVLVEYMYSDVFAPRHTKRCARLAARSAAPHRCG